MRINTRFPVAVHILALLTFNKEENITSELIARSVNTNPVVIRRINAMLKKANLITIQAGVGGARLNLAPKDITLLDIYNAVKSSEQDPLFDLHSNPSEKCKVGANIHEALSEPFNAAQKSLEDTLKKYTLFDIVKNINKNI
ncbi:Rrf2 family transcriptional regulator [Clostridium sp. 19966]|uniref:Rrf2 family transcriptional regulator n=1 Tax=Clostridium sp. 19966 TaxID=2768166 RepID=UPI0028DD74AF|nr:Rrf2 family transcriptional regulator [Clostridium sp. 19966]MDT8718978.1 Rrf2 family transcriptional regulator [Clostridium sp. 19966]